MSTTGGLKERVGGLRKKGREIKSYLLGHYTIAALAQAAAAPWPGSSLVPHLLPAPPEYVGQSQSQSQRAKAGKANAQTKV